MVENEKALGENLLERKNRHVRHCSRRSYVTKSPWRFSTKAKTERKKQNALEKWLIDKATFTNSAKHRLRRFNRQWDVFQVYLKRSKLPCTRFLPIAAGMIAVPSQKPSGIEFKTKKRKSFKKEKRNTFLFSPLPRALTLHLDSHKMDKGLQHCNAEGPNLE